MIWRIHNDHRPDPTRRAHQGAAGEPRPAPARTPSLAKLSPASVSLLARADRAAQPPDSEASSFFKTPKGVAVLVLIGAGFGYTLYSKSHDRVMSPVR